MKHIILITFLLTFVNSYAQTVSKTMKRLPDTGQTTGYTSTFGEDADYPINPPFYEQAGAGIMLDTVTGLMWQQTDGGEMTIENAALYCDTLALGGYTDWRMPSCHELFSILNHDRVNPAIDTAYFTLTNADYWWSSEKQANDTTKVWVTNAGGGVGNHPKSETVSAGGVKQFHVRAVRDVLAPPTVSSHFVSNADGTVTDSLTDLIWQPVAYADSLLWEDALQLADTLTYAGYNDWRLPNIKELQSINDEALISPSINSAYFNIGASTRLWSSTSLPNQTTKAWYLDTHFGVTTYAEKNSKQMVLCVRTATSVSGTTEISFDNPDMPLYPNPCNGYFNLNTSGREIDFKIIDLAGQVITAGKTTGTIQVANLPAGSYLVELQNNTRRVFKKLVKY